jgi:Reverse transcriptase (RNA-dependent DNA polymerase)/TIR domain
MTSTLPNAASDYERFLDKENFLLAWRRVRNSTRIEVKDRASLNIFSPFLDAQIEILIEDLRNDEFRPSTPPFIHKPKKSGSLRPFPFLDMRDRLVYQALGNIVMSNARSALEEFADKQVFSPVIENFDGDFPFSLTRSRGEKKGQFQKFYETVQSQKSDFEKNKFFVRTDISAFYPSIDHHLLVSNLSKFSWISSDKLLSWLSDWLKEWSTPESDLKLPQGVPIGYETSDMLACLFLYEVDKEAAMYGNVVRYVDDIYFFTSDHKKAQYGLSRIDLALQKRGLSLQTAKSIIEKNNGTDPESETIATFKFQAELYDLEMEMQSGTPQTDPRIQAEFKKLIMEVLDIDENSIEQALNWDHVDFKDSDTIIAYLLYRIKDKFEAVRQLALHLLRKMPHRSFHATAYLSLFDDDYDVIDELLSIANDEYEYVQVRADCLQCAKILSDANGEINAIREIARQWCDPSMEWLLRATAIAILQAYREDAEFLIDIFQYEPTDVLRASIFFGLIQYPEYVYRFESQLDNSNWLIDSIMIYIVATTKSIDIPNIMFQNPSNFFSKLTKNINHHPEYSGLRFELQRLLGLNLHPKFPVDQVFTNPSEVEELLSRSFYAKETNLNAYLDSLVQVLELLSRTVYRITGLTVSQILDSKQNKSLDEIAHNASKLPAWINAAALFGTPGRQAIHHKGGIVFLFHKNISEVIAVLIDVLQQYYRLSDSEILPGSTISKVILSANDAPNNHRPITIFISYSHRDDTLRKKLLDHMTVMIMRQEIEVWHDRKLFGGDEWSPEIEEKLNRAEIILLLITSNFISSTFIQTKESPRALERAKKKECKTIPIILRDADWRPLYWHLQAFPRDGKPIRRNGSYSDAAFTEVVQLLRDVVNDIRGQD